MNLSVWELVQTNLNVVWEIRVHLPSHCDLWALTLDQLQSHLSPLCWHKAKHCMRASPKSCSSCCWGELVRNPMHVRFNQDHSHLRVLATKSQTEFPGKSCQLLIVGPWPRRVTSQCFSFPICKTWVKILWWCLTERYTSPFQPCCPNKTEKKKKPTNKNSSVTYMYSAFQVLVSICKPKITLNTMYLLCSFTSIFFFFSFTTLEYFPSFFFSPFLPFWLVFIDKM